MTTTVHGNSFNKSPFLNKATRRKTIRFALLFFALIWHSLIEPSYAHSAVVKASVTFSKQQQADLISTPEEQLELLQVVQHSWDAYLHLDSKSFLSYYSVDVIRMSQRYGKIQYGREQIAAELNEEWGYYERPRGEISEQLLISDLTIHLSEDKQSAWVRYQIDAVGGARWHYDDSAYVFELFSKVDNQWKITYYTDSWGLDVGARKDDLPFEFDFVYPVKNLDRAQMFYQQFLGNPIYRTEHRAIFQFTSGDFILDDGQFKVPAKPTSALPNGYAIFYVHDLDNAVDQIDDDSLLEGDDDYLQNGEDPYVVAEDPDGNAFILEQKVYKASDNQERAQLRGFESSSNQGSKAALIMSQAWLNMDVKTLQGYCSGSCIWFDDTGHKELGWIQSADLSDTFLHDYWHNLDHNKHNILADEDINHIKVREYGDFTLVSYQRTLLGKGQHVFKQSSLVTQIFSKSSSSQLTFIAGFQAEHHQVKDLDYSGYPETDLELAAAFYQDTLKLGSPYKDEDYRGFWGRGYVFGIYTADFERDHIPREDRANGYISFWVNSATKIYSSLKKQNVQFPVIEAINDDSGISTEMGYKELVATDSEGNLVIFTEYSGRMK